MILFRINIGGAILKCFHHVIFAIAGFKFLFHNLLVHLLFLDDLLLKE